MWLAAQFFTISANVERKWVNGGEEMQSLGLDQLITNQHLANMGSDLLAKKYKFK